MRSSRSDLLRSLGAELIAQADRVRSLIGGQHWLSDGLHREALLAAVIQRHLPASTLLTHGFLLSAHRDHLCSSELDILLLDTSREGPLLHQGGLSFAHVRQALVAISVKATCTSQSLDQTAANLASARNVAAADNPQDTLWTGGYFFMLDDTYRARPDTLMPRLAEVIHKHRVEPPPHGAPRGIQALCAGTDHFISITYSQRHMQLRGYHCPGMAPGIFIAHLLAHIALARGADGHSLSDLIDGAGASLIDPVIERDL